MGEDRENADAHVILANKIFRAAGFSLTAMQFPRSEEALKGLLRFNRAPVGFKEPFAWRYFPNAYMRDNWQKYYPLEEI